MDGVFKTILESGFKKMWFWRVDSLVLCQRKVDSFKIYGFKNICMNVDLQTIIFG